MSLLKPVAVELFEMQGILVNIGPLSVYYITLKKILGMNLKLFSLIMLLLLTLASQSKVFAVETDTTHAMQLQQVKTEHQTKHPRTKHHSDTAAATQQMDSNTHTCCKASSSSQYQSKCQQSGSCSSGHCLSSVVLPTTTSSAPLPEKTLELSLYSTFTPSHPSSIPYRPPIIG
ncbi:hypothetical protein [Zooshikella ganghwensis]|uniref:hypothetical protein n=1 Tax=Zooshikella ganghwensis TaxID=202772 RepID=UPI000485D044|nr:hypothetical protein [Zooshikella ganghwensis]